MKKQENVEELLEEIRDNTSTPWWRTFLNGFLYGAGWVIGTLAAFAVLGWLLSLFGIIPGFDVITSWLQQLLNTRF